MRNIRVCRTPGAFTPDMDAGRGRMPFPPYVGIYPDLITSASDGQFMETVPLTWWDRIASGSQDYIQPWDYPSTSPMNQWPQYRQNVWKGHAGLFFNGERNLVFNPEADVHWYPTSLSYIITAVFIPYNVAGETNGRFFGQSAYWTRSTGNVYTWGASWSNAIEYDIPNVMVMGWVHADDGGDHSNGSPGYMFFNDNEMKTSIIWQDFAHRIIGSDWIIEGTVPTTMLEFSVYAPNPDASYELSGLPFASYGATLRESLMRKWRS